MNYQKIYDKVAKHLLTQMKQSVSADLEGCAYRGEGGTMCAIGCLIPDDLYRKGMEGKHAQFVLRTWPELNKIIGAEDGRDYNFLLALQRIHDRRQPEAWLNELTDFARAYDLEPVTVVDGEALINDVNAAFDAVLGSKP